jgi:hypothetical protein
MMNKRINHNNLLPWFTDDHSTLPAAYLKSTQKLLDGLQTDKQQATSAKLQAPSLTDDEG